MIIDVTNSNKTVIFDFDGTLANTVDLVVRIYNEHAEELGADTLSIDEFPTLRTLGYKKAMKAKNLHWHVLPKLVFILKRGVREHLHEVQPYEGIQRLINELKSAGMMIGVLTSNDGALVQEFLDTHGFPAFDFVVSEKTVFGKEKALKKIIERHKLDRARVVYVGDEPRDVTASKKAGVHVVGVTWGFGGRESMLATLPDTTVHTMDELRTALL